VNYYSKVFSVIPISDKIDFGGNSKCGDFTIPQEIQDNGYEGTDLLIFL